MQLPVTDPVLIVALSMGIFLLVPLLFERFKVPGIVGLIIAGAVFGPNVLGVLARDTTIVLLGTVGLLYLMFMVGLELDLHGFTQNRNRSIGFGIISFLIPQIAGTALALAFGYTLISAILLGAVFASHTVLPYPIARRLGIVKNAAVVTALGGTILTEILALLVLAVVVSAAGGALGLGFWFTLVISFGLYVAAVLLGVPRLGRWFFRKVSGEGTTEFIFVMAVLFGVAYGAHAGHVEPIIGALLAGLALNRLIPEHGPLMNRINFVGNALFIPFFLLSVGMLVNVQALTTIDAWVFATALAVVVTLSKWLAAKLTEKLYGYTPDEGWVVFGLSVPHASGTLAIVLVGFEVGIFDQAEVNGVVLMILATSLIGPWAVEKFGRRVALREEDRPYEASKAPQRVLIPISNPATAEALLDLAFYARDQSSEEPIHPLMVVPDRLHTSEAQVAEAERMLSHAVIYAAGAEVPAVPLTRVDRNIAHGITRGVAETRSSMVIIGWDGRVDHGHTMFGSVLEQVLEQTKQLVLVAKLGHPLNTTERLVVVIPPASFRSPGFYGAVRTIKQIATQIGAPVLGLTVGVDPERYLERLENVKPAAPVQVSQIAGWASLIGELGERLRPSDLVVVLSARRGTISWHRELERLPAQLARQAPESFIMMYPPEAEPAAAPGGLDAVLPAALAPERVVFGLKATTFAGAMREILACAFEPDGANLERVAEVLIRREREFTTEMLPGVVVPHARVKGISESMLFLGISDEGILFPMADQAAHLIFVLLSPAADPQQHLRDLAAVARLISNPGVVQQLRSTRGVEDLVPSGEARSAHRRVNEAAEADASVAV